MLIVAISVFILLIFPIFLNLSAEFNLNEQKARFKIKLFGLIRIFYGVAKFNESGIKIEFFNKKTKQIPYSSLFTIRESVKPFMDYHFYNINLTVYCGDGENVLAPIAFSFISSYALKFIKWFFYNKKPYLKINDEYFIYENEKFLNAEFQATILLNILMIILSFIKIVVGKIINGLRKQKQNKCSG